MKKFISFLFLGLLGASLAQAASPQPGEKLAKSQSLTVNAGAAPASLDPAKIEGTVEGTFARNLFETLVISDDNDKPIPGAAESYSHSDDYKTWTFKLRKNAKWSNGDPLLASDFVFAWRRLVDPKTASPYSSYLNYLKLANASKIIDGKAKPETLGIEAVDDHTLVLHLEDPVPYADLLVEMYVLAPVPQKVVEKLGDAWAEPKNLVSNGAFKIDSFTLNEDAKLSKNPYYWDAKNVLLTKLTILQIQNESVAFNRYRAGSLDISTFPMELIDSVKKDFKNEFNTGPTLCTYYYEFNNAKAPFTDKRVRQALSMAIDRDTLVNKVTKLGQIPAYNFSPPSINEAQYIKPPEWSKLSMKDKSAQAIKLLAEAGFDKSHPLNFNLLYNTNEAHKKIAIAIAAMWKQNLGGAVNVKMQNQEWKTFLSTRRLGQQEVSRAGWCSDYNEASTFLNTFLSDSSNNQGQFKNKAYDEIMKKTVTAPSEDERAKLYGQAEDILAAESALAPIYFYTGSELVKPYVRGYKLKPSLNLYYKNFYILEH